MINATEKSAFLFSGTGTQKPGMGRDFYEQFPEFRRAYECASDIFGFDVPEMAFEGTAARVNSTETAHRLIYAYSVGVYAVASKRLPLPMAFGGHSLGEIAALTACGVFTEEQGFTVLKWRSQYLAEAEQCISGAMFAILGSTSEKINAACEACAKAGAFVVPVNFNAPAQTVISGDAAAVNTAAEILKQGGARALSLGVNVPFHTIRLKPASDSLKISLASLKFNPQPKARFFSNVTGQEMTDFSDIPDYLARQMISPVLFVDEINAMQAAGVQEYIELGTSRVLTGLVKKILAKSVTINIDNAEIFR